MTTSLQLTATLEHTRVSTDEKTASHAVITMRGSGASVDAVRPRLTVVGPRDAKRRRQMIGQQADIDSSRVAD